MPILLENGSYLLNTSGGYILLEADIASSGSVSVASGITFECAQLMGLQHTCNFFGQSFNYSNTQVINLRGRLTGSYDSIDGVWDGMNNLIAMTTGNALAITINSVNVGTGRVTSLNFDKGTDVGEKFYSATIEIPRHAGSGMFNNSGYMPATGSFFGSTATNIVTFFTGAQGKYIKDFSENYSLDVISSGKFSYNKDINFSLDYGLYEELGVLPNTYAKSLMEAAKKSYGDINLLSAFYPDYYKNNSGISYTNQSFDVINYQYSFSERFEFQTGLPYIWNYNHSLQLNDAIISVDEKGTITSSQSVGTTIAAANTAWATIETGIFQRVSGVYIAYTGFIGYSGGCGLKNQAEQSSIKKDNCAGTIEYSKSYSNSPFTQSGYSYSYSDEITVDEDGYTYVSENGQLKAYRNIRPSGFDLVYSGYLSKSGEIYSRITGLYASSTGALHDCSITGGLNFDNSKETYKEYDAEVEYDWAYTDNPNYRQDGLFYKAETSYTQDLPLHLVNYFPIGYNSIIAQRSNQSTRGVFTNSISLVGKENTKINDFITGALSRVRKPSGTDIYASDYSYQYNPLDQTFAMDLTYNYTLYRGPNEFLV